jgi:hypothetical protein
VEGLTTETTDCRLAFDTTRPAIVALAAAAIRATRVDPMLALRSE